MVGNNAWNEYVCQLTENQFPNLKSTGYRLTSKDTIDYNCVAYAAGDEENWWWPDKQEQQYWPPNIPREETLEAFIQAYQSINYEICQDGCLEEGFQKIAIYTDSKKFPTHVALQLDNGKWTSKIGPNEDIEHNTLEGLYGDYPAYGSVACFMKRSLVS
jgi:hypothetical protein